MGEELLYYWTTVITLPILLPPTVCFSSLVLDPAVDDFVLMHGVFMPNSQLCPLLLAQYPFCHFFNISSFIQTVDGIYVVSTLKVELFDSDMDMSVVHCILQYCNVTDSYLNCAIHWFCLWKRWSSSGPSGTNELLAQWTPPFTL